MNKKSEKALSNNIWYHATTFNEWANFCRNGVDVQYNKDTSDSLDFGYGFYLSPSKTSALSFILGYIKNKVVEDYIPLILEFKFCPLEHIKEFKIQTFTQYDDEFAEFVFENRVHNKFGSRQHSFDIIYGCMTDSVPAKIINYFKDGVMSKLEAIEHLKIGSSRRQLSIHNQNLCNEPYFQLLTATKVILDSDLNTVIREEKLDVNDYNATK